MPNRRTILTLGALGLGYWGLRGPVPELWARYGPLPEFTTDEMPAGFRRFDGAGEVTSGLSDPFIGLAPDRSPSKNAGPISDEMLNSLLFAGVAKGRVALNYFTDYNCPYCRVLGRELREAVAERPCHADLIYHELPLLGPGSILSARAALAARRQNAYQEMHDALNTGIVRINQAYILKIAKDLSLDVDQLLSDMAEPWVGAEITRTQAVIDRFGVIGTPFLLVGRTAVFGRIKPGLLARLIDLERSGVSITRC